MTTKQLENYTNVLLGKARIVRAKTEPTTEERIVNRMVARNQRDHSKMSVEQIRASVLRGCL